MVTNIVKKNGVLAFYNGLSASVLRQATYSTTRFAVYESGKGYLNKGKMVDMPFIHKVLLAGSSGLIGSLIGTKFFSFLILSLILSLFENIGSPADLVNVRMQNDIKLPDHLKRNYKHCFDALFRISKTEGVQGLFKGKN